MPKSFSTFGCAGDKICFISALHTLARLNNEVYYTDHFQDVIDSYGDRLLKFGRCPDHTFIDVYNRHRVKNNSNDINYLGTFVRELSNGIKLPIPFELPKFKKEESKCLIQIKSNSRIYLDNLEYLVNYFCSLTGEKLYAIGETNTDRSLSNVDYSLLENKVSSLMSHIYNAKCVLTPRSLSAHVAAAYGVPAIVWTREDGENWHLNYGGWPNYKLMTESSKVRIRKGVDYFTDFLNNYGT